MLQVLKYVVLLVVVFGGGISLGLAFLFAERKVGAWRRGRR